MKTWNPYPLVRLFFPFAAGIITAILIDKAIFIPLWLLFLLFLPVGLYVFYLSRLISYRLRWIFGVYIFMLIFIYGFEITIIRTPKFDKSHYINLQTPGKYTCIRITAPPQIREKSVKAEAEIFASADSTNFTDCTGNAILYFSKDTFSEGLKYGDLLLLDAKIGLVPVSGNPDQFDYRHYLAMKGVYHQAFVPQGAFTMLGKGYRSMLYQIAFDTRDKILSIYTENGLSGKEFAVTSALLIGYTEKLDADLLKEYSGTGAMHILSVSGLHVGVIFIVLNTLLFFLDKFKYGRVPKTIILILFIWAYAVLTGLSPSVLRASAMFSLIVLGRAFSRETDIYNSLATSMLVLLLVNPYFITDIGFQLSYIAVIGIVALQPYVSAWWKPRWWLIKQGWGIISVSIAAQMATLPICLYYFHQFPNYFLLTNLIAIPLSSFVMYLGMAVLAFSFIPMAAVLLSKVLVWLVYALNTSIGMIERLPGSVSEGLFISLPEMFLMYLIILAFLWFLIRKKKFSLLIAMFSVVVLMSSFLYRNINREQQKEWVVYNVKGTSAIDLVSGRQRTLLTDSLMLTDETKMDFYSEDYMDRKGIKSSLKVNIKDDSLCNAQHGVYKKNGFIQFLGCRIAVVSDAEASLKKMKVDYVVISGNPKLKINDLLETYDTRMIIIDASNSKYKAGQWVKECKNKNMPCWSVPDSGAFVNLL